MRVPRAFKDFDIAQATVSVWLFKKGRRKEGIPRFNARWVDTDDELDQALREVVTSEIARISEVRPYGLLAENNEASALKISAEETHIGLIIEQTAAPSRDLKITSSEEANNTLFYVIKLNDGPRALYAVRRTDSSWQSRFGRTGMPVLFKGTRLKLNPNPGFYISRAVDFLVLGDDVLITKKLSFESITEYKQAHVEDFEALKKEAAFQALFVSIDVLVTFIGTNKIRLRRAAAVKSKGYYKDPVFLRRLKDRYQEFGLQLQFDTSGRIVASTDESCADVITALLDHRLQSPFSNAIYDVEDAVPAPALSA